MGELDIERLKRLRDRRWQPGLTESAAIGELQAVLPAIIAALEDRDRLRLTIERLTSGEAVHEMATALALAEQDRERLRATVMCVRDRANEMLERDEQNHNLRDIARWSHRALEGRDG